MHNVYRQVIQMQYLTTLSHLIKFFMYQRALARIVQAAEDAKQRFDLKGHVKEYLKWYDKIVCEWQPEPWHQ